MRRRRQRKAAGQERDGATDAKREGTAAGRRIRRSRAGDATRSAGTAEEGRRRRWRNKGAWSFGRGCNQRRGTGEPAEREGKGPAAGCSVGRRRERGAEHRPAAAGPAPIFTPPARDVDGGWGARRPQNRRLLPPGRRIRRFVGRRPAGEGSFRRRRVGAQRRRVPWEAREWLAGLGAGLRLGRLTGQRNAVGAGPACHPSTSNQTHGNDSMKIFPTPQPNTAMKREDACANCMACHCTNIIVISFIPGSGAST